MSAQGTAWPNVLADLEIKRDALTQMIGIIRTHFVGDAPGEMPDSAAAVPARRAGKTKSAASGTNERTNEARRTPAARSRPDDAKGDAILAMLKTHGGTMKPSGLAKALKISRPLLTYRLKSLITSGAVIATGNTGNRQFGLPVRSGRAKEVP